MTTEHQPGSPGAVDLDELDRLLATHRTSTDADAVTDAVVRLTRALPRILAEVLTLRARVESYAMDLAALEGTNAANERALRIQLERLQEERSRAESAEARVAALEKLFNDAGQGEHNVLALIDHYQSEAMAASERRREAEARVKELEARANTLPALLRAILEVEKGESR